MKKLISTILTLVTLIIAQSCRQQDDFLTSADDDNQKLIFKRGADSIKTDSADIIDKPVIGDPPPKNGHQW